MTFASKPLATVVILAAGVTGLTACGDDVTHVKDKNFITRCKKSVDKNATFKAYDTDICTCVQDKLKEQGLGNKDADSKSLKPKGTAATVECVQQAVKG